MSVVAGDMVPRMERGVRWLLGNLRTISRHGAPTFGFMGTHRTDETAVIGRTRIVTNGLGYGDNMAFDPTLIVEV